MHDTLFKHTYIQRQQGKWVGIQPGGGMHWWDRQTGFTGWDEMWGESRKSQESKFHFPSPHGRVFKPVKHKKQNMGAPRGLTRVRLSTLSYKIIRSYCDDSCWHSEWEATENGSIMKTQFISFCPWELQSLREYLEASVHIKGAEGLQSTSEDQNHRNHMKLWQEVSVIQLWICSVVSQQAFYAVRCYLLDYKEPLLIKQHSHATPRLSTFVSF